MQVPAWQVSVCVHALPSSQAPPVVGAHVPTLPGTLHAWHWPQDVAVVLQHTPSTQLPAEHWALDVHVCPLGDPEDDDPEEPDELDELDELEELDEPEDEPDEVPEELPEELPDELLDEAGGVT